jgi:hypothetical protein
MPAGVSGGSCPDSNRRGERHSVIRLQGHLDPMPLPKSSTLMLRHEPSLIATTGYQMTASSPRGTFSQAELTTDRVITGIIIPTRQATRWARPITDSQRQVT